MREEIRVGFVANLERVEHFASSYDERQSDLGPGNGAVSEGDLLRAAVVFLHAALEDLVRSLVAWRFPDVATAIAFAQVPLLGTGPRAGKFDLAHLVAHRGSTVEHLLRASVDEWLSKQSYNHVGDLKAAVESIGLDKTLIDPFATYLGPMIDRRHWIVHRADRIPQVGREHQFARTIDVATVRTWAAKVREFGEVLLAAV